MSQISNGIQKDYKALAKTYEARWESFVSPARTWLLNHLSHALEAPFHVLDLGCGTGECLSMVTKKYPNAILTGFDLSIDMLEIAKDKLSGVQNVTLEASDLEALKLKKTHYDVIMSMFVLHHIVDQDKFLEKIIQSAKSGGDIYIADYAVDSLPMRCAEIYWRLFLPSHYKAHSSRRLRKVLEQHQDIEIIASERFTPNWFWRQQAYHLKKN